MKAGTILSSIGAFLIFIISVIFISCAKNESTAKGQSRLQVFLADDPGDYEEVLIDVLDIQVNVTGEAGSWQSLAGVNAGVYNLLKLVNDQDTLLADASIPSGRIYQLRLILGPENYVKVHGSMIKLNTPGDQQSGLKMNIQQNVGNGTVYKILLDFDVARSIVASGDGNYDLKPTIRTIFESVGGSFRGWVNPKGFPTVIYAIQGTDTIVSTFTGNDGGYIIKGIAQGSYSVYFNPSDSVYKDSLLSGIDVVNKEVTNLDTMLLHQ